MRTKTFLALFLLAFLLLMHAAAQQIQHSEIQIEPKAFDEFVGEYRFADNPDTLVAVFREGDKFFMQIAGSSGNIETFAEAPNTFFFKAAAVQQTFIRDSGGKVTGMIWSQGGRERRVERISNQPVIEAVRSFQRREEMIRMRDGVRLYTLIFTPSNQTENLPIIIQRTPYGISGITSDSISRELAADGYIFVYQDIRGRFKSEGEFMMDRPPRGTNSIKPVDESTDTYDTIDWLVKNVPRNNGRVGIVGVSYGGWLAAVATIDPHPALKASSPQAPMTDTYLGDDFFHNGAFRQSYGYEYVKEMESSKELAEISFDRDAYDWYLQLGSLAKITAESRGRWPTWNAFVAHPNYDDYWKPRAAERYLKPTTVATLVVGGWWDQEDFFGALATYEALEKYDTRHQNFIVLGPWNHGGWGGFGRTLGDIDFGNSTGLYFRTKIQAPWLASYLKDNRPFNEPEAVTFQSGSNRWTTSDHWPPREAVARDLFLRSGGKLSFQKAVASNTQESESYISDPSSPVPYRQRPIQPTYGPGSTWNTWLVQDQRFLAGRNDVVSWQTEILDEDLTIDGDVMAHLFASTTGTDSDWIAKVIDVYPERYPEDPKMEGFQLMIVEEIFRGRFRRGFEKPAPVRPNQVQEYAIDLHANNHTFKKGHRVMVQVQSSWFPLYDRNPQKFVPNIFQASPEDYQTATQRVYESARYPSRITLPVMK
jgi:putative CocE/NonD family hydrolase